MYADRVRRGAELLDRMRPGWARAIVADRLMMESCDRCILGQLFGGYLLGYQILKRQLPPTFLFSAAEHGFTLFDNKQSQRDCNFSANLNKFALLADAWRAAIRERLDAAPAATGAGKEGR